MEKIEGRGSRASPHATTTRPFTSACTLTGVGSRPKIVITCDECLRNPASARKLRVSYLYGIIQSVCILSGQ